MANDSQYDYILKEIQKLNDKLKTLGGASLKNIDASIQSFGGGVEGANAALEQLTKNFNALDTSVNYLYDNLKKSIAVMKGGYTHSNNIVKSFTRLNEISNKLKFDQDGINTLNLKQLKALETKIASEERLLELTVEHNKEKVKELNYSLSLKNREKQLEQQRLAGIQIRRKLTEEEKQKFKTLTYEAKSLNDQLVKANMTIMNGTELLKDPELGIKAMTAATRDRIILEERIQEKMGLTGTLLKGMVGVLSKLGIDPSYFEGIEEEMRRVVESGGGAWKVFGKGVEGVFQGIGNAMKDPLVQITLLLKIVGFFKDAALKANVEMVAMGKSLGYGSEKTREMRDRFVAIEASSKNINVTTANLAEAQNQLTAALGYSYEYSQDQLETQITLTKQFGFQAEEAAALTRYAIINGKTSKETLTSLERAVTSSRNQLKVGVNVNAVMREAVKISGQLGVNLGNNPEHIAKAIVQAKALGYEIEQTKKMSESLLDFESSISAELEAQLMTGIDLNLDKARILALQGKYVEVAEEITKQGLTQAKYSQMNVFQQESFAKAIGMTTDELAEQLKKREQAIASGKSLKQLQEEEVAEANRRQSIQERFNIAIEKLQSLVGNLVAGPFGDLLDIMVKGLELLTEYGTAIKSLIVGMTTFYTIRKAVSALEAFGLINQTRMNAMKVVEGTVGKKNLLTSIADAAAKVTGMSATTMGIAAGIALAAGVATYAFLSSKDANDYASDGYGKRTMFSPEGAVRFNDNDTIIAGTNLGGDGDRKDRKQEAPAAVNLNLSELKAEIAKLSSIVDSKLSELITAQSRDRELVTHDGYVGWKIHGIASTGMQ